MKFAREFQAAVSNGGYPEDWVKSAIRYAQLKKCIRKVQSELSSIGLDATTLAELSSASINEISPRGRRGSGAVAFQYDFAADVEAIHPKLTIFVQLEDGLPVHAGLSPGTRAYLERLACGQRVTQASQLCMLDMSRDQTMLESDSQQLPITGPTPATEGNIQPAIQQVEVPLTFDAEFFGLLQGEVTTLEALQAGEKKAMSNEITSLSQVIANLTVPKKRDHKDLSRWRALFELYLEAGVFFSTNEADHGRRDSKSAQKRLQWFQEEADTRGLVKSFKLAASREALERFLNINLTLLRNLKFQEINSQAVAKILKKFDKRTSLGAKRLFPKLLETKSIMSEDLAKAVCAEISNEIVHTVPLLSDYQCPICLALAYSPVRLQCGHLFCIRCVCTMQRKGAEYCPMCRSKVVQAAVEGDIDLELKKYLKYWFPKERKLKNEENEIERIKEERVARFGEKHRDESGCTIM